MDIQAKSADRLTASAQGMSAQGISMRDIGPDDARAVWQLEHDIFPEDAMSLASLESGLSREWVRARALFDGGRMIAYLIMRYLGADKAEAELLTVGVSKQYRSQGLATRLMNDMIVSARDAGCYEIYLEVRQSNAAAIAMYKKYGFKVLDRRKRYYKNPVEDALVMKLMLRRIACGRFVQR